MGSEKDIEAKFVRGNEYLTNVWDAGYSLRRI